MLGIGNDIFRFFFKCHPVCSVEKGLEGKAGERGYSSTQKATQIFKMKIMLSWIKETVMK